MRYLLAFSLLAGLVLAQDPSLDLPVHPAHLEKRPDPVTDTPQSAPEPKPTPPPEPVLPEPEPEIDDPKDEPPPVFFGEELESASGSVVFVIDISGSMYQPGWSFDLGYGGPQKIVTAKRELSKAIQGVPSYWSFTVLAYDDSVYLWRESLVDANEEHKASAVSWVAALTPLGMTGTGPAVAQALMLDRQNLLVVLLTDGAPNFPEANPAWHRRVINDANSQGAAINVFGIETDLNPGMKSFCVGVAVDSGGTYIEVR